MRVGRYASALVAVAAVWAASAPTRAQQAPPAPPVKAPPAKPAKEKDDEKPSARTQAVEQAEPEILYVPSDDGKEYVPLIRNHTLEEIRRALLALDGGPMTGSRPRYRLKSLTAKGNIENAHAVLQIELEIDASDERWVRVPLRMGGLVLDRPAEIEGEGQHLLDYDSTAREYVAWFRGTTQKPHRVVLHALAPIEHQTDRTLLRINAPRAVTSQLVFSVPVVGAVGEVSKDSVLTDTRQVEGATEFHASGLSGDFSMAWQKPDTARHDSPAILSVDGQVVAKVDGRGIRTSAALRVNSFGREFDNFRVRLPRGATLLPDNPTDYAVAPVEVDAAAADEPRVVEVRLKTKTSGPLLVKLVTDQGHDVTRGGSFELGGFEVVGAVRQYGYLAVQVKDDWQVTFGQRQGVQQSEDLPAEMPRDDVVAGFVYYGQPYSLPARVVPLPTRTSVAPSFRVRVEPRQLLLDATFKYHVAGAKIFAIELHMADWTLDPTTLGPPGVVNLVGRVGQGNSQFVPLQQAASGEVQLKFTARKEIAADARSLDIRFPQALADSFGDADVTIVPGDNVVLAPRVAELEGLVAQPRSSADDDGDSSASESSPRTPVWAYRADSPEARFVADFQRATRTVAARVASHVQLSTAGAKVSQTYRYAVAHEPIESLWLEVPPSLAQTGAVAVKLGGKQLKTELVRGESSEGATPARLNVELPEPRLGEFEITTVYEWRDKATGDVPPLTTVRREVPLLMPGDAEVSLNEATVASVPGLLAQPLGDLWTQTEEPNAERSAAMRLTAAGAPGELALALRLDDEQESAAVLLERAVVQTSLSRHARQDRAVYRFSTPERRVALRLPAGAVGARYALATDGRPPADVTRDVAERGEERIVSLPAGDWHVLDVSYELPRLASPGDRQSFDLPRFAGRVIVRRSYFQLVLPPDEFLLSGPAGWTPEWVWQRRFFAWWRRATLDDRELYLWAGAPGNAVSPSGNRYLFSAIEPLAAFGAWTIRRSLLVLMSSGLVLLVGLIWLYWPAARKPVWLFAVGVATLAAAAVWPDAAPIWLQSAVLGGLLTLLAVLLDWLMARPRRHSVVYRGGSSSIIRPASTHSQPRPPAIAPPVSTETAAVVVESNPPGAAP